MRYVGIYWALFAPMMKRSIAARHGAELAERSIRWGRAEYRRLLARADELGPGNPMASNAYFAYVFAAAWLGGGKTLTPDEMAEVFSVGDFSADKVSGYDAFAWGCSAQGDEVLEEYEFEPLFDSCAAGLAGKKVALFGSYGWGDGAWMRSWEQKCSDKGISLAAESVICNEAPDDDGKAKCAALGAALA